MVDEVLTLLADLKTSLAKIAEGIEESNVIKNRTLEQLERLTWALKPVGPPSFVQTKVR